MYNNIKQFCSGIITTLCIKKNERGISPFHYKAISSSGMNSALDSKAIGLSFATENN